MPPKKKSTTKKKKANNAPKRSANRNSLNRVKSSRSWRTHIMVEQKTLEKALPVLVVKNGAAANEREAADIILAEVSQSLNKSRKAQNRFGKKNAAEIGANAGMAMTNATANSPTANAVEVAAEVAANVVANTPLTAGGGRKKKKRGSKKSKRGSKKRGSKKSKKKFFGLF